jgi:hypothetical protein
MSQRRRDPVDPRDAAPKVVASLVVGKVPRNDGPVLLPQRRVELSPANVSSEALPDDACVDHRLHVQHQTQEFIGKEPSGDPPISLVGPFDRKNDPNACLSRSRQKILHDLHA